MSIELHPRSSRSCNGASGGTGGGRRRSNNGCSSNGQHADVNGHAAAAEMIDNVESSV